MLTMPDTRTIAEIEAAGYSWIAAECCKGTVIAMLRALHHGAPPNAPVPRKKRARSYRIIK